MRSIFLVLSFSCFSFIAVGQSFNYVKATLDLTVRGFNPCGTPTPDNGYIEITVNAASGGTATLIFISGLNSGVSDAGIPIPVGTTYTFDNFGIGLPDDTYNFIIRDVPANTINTFTTPVTYPPIILADLPAVALSEDIRIDNTVCTFPTNGQIQSSISGGSQTLVGGGSYTYVWKSNNGFAGLPTPPAVTDGTTPLNLATILGVPGLPGGTYSLEVTDNYGVCGTVTRNFTLTDPSPGVYNITTASPTTICFGDDISVALNNSDGPSVTYEIRRNGTSTGITFPGTASGPFVMTFSSALFSDGDVIQVRATDGFCSPATMIGSVVVNINPQATVDAGLPQTICSDATASLAGVIGGSAASATWTTSGDGTFDNATLLNAVYTPGATDITNGNVTLTLTTDDPAGPCPPAVDNVVIGIDQAATVDAGFPQTICSDAGATLAGVIGGSAVSSTWTTSGDGTFDNAALLNAVYTPGPTDITNGTATLTLTTNDPAGPCPAVVDNVIITIELAATVDAGPPQTICSDAGSVALAGTFGGSATSATWTTSGDGTFDNATLLNAVYTPGATDITNGTVTLTLTTDDPVGTCPFVTDNVVVTITPVPDATFSGLNGPYCDNNSVVTLTPTTPGGTFSGPGVSGNTFDPNLAGAGSHVIQYQVTVSGCTNTSTQNVDVNPAPDATIDPAGPFCASDVAVNLTAVTPGGTWSGAGITDASLGTFDPAVAGAGVKVITYQVTVSGCTSMSTRNITVFNAPNATITPAGPFCTTDAQVTLNAATAGGVWSGTGITDAVLGTFNPAVAGAGSHIITYSVTVGSCSDVQNTTIFVGLPPDATITPAGPFCASDAAVNLTAADPGGTWSGTGITDAAAGTFDPFIATAGTHTITYTVTIGGCTDVDNIDILVNPAPNATITAAGPFCTVDAPVNLTAVTGGGTWSGTGIIDPVLGTFDPATAGAGSHVITYSITVGICSDTDNITIDVATPPDATITPVGPFCTNDVAVTLAAVTGGGTWSGTGITDPVAGIFDPSTAGAGLHTITYTIAIGGCNDTDNIDIQVDLAPDATITAAGPFCTLDAPVNLVAATLGGTWSGTGITDAAAGTFDPATAGAGSHVITYSITTGLCTDTDNITIDVATPPDATITAVGPFCTNDAAVTLVAVTAGGTWSGTGITDAVSGTFDPATAGAGLHTITYTIAIGGCNDTDNIDIQVDLAPDATITAAGPFCTLDSPVNLAAATNGGTWSGSGITDGALGTFDPATAGAGSHVITYSITSGLCTDMDNISIDVATPPDATITAAGPFCANAAPTNLVAVTAGGTWSGTGITDPVAGTFDPATAGAGLHTITYTIAIGGCNDTDNIDIQVDPAPVATINVAGPFCPTSPAVTLVGLPAGGTWSGTGITDVNAGTFDPAIAGTGTHPITYTVITGGCSSVANRSIVVRSAADPACGGGGTGDCATVVIDPQPSPATCANSDGSIFFDIIPAVPAVNNTGVIININGPVNDTKYNQFTFGSVPAGIYAYTIVYGDSSCIKTGFVTIDQSGTVGTPTVSEIVPPLCFGASTGSARILVSNQAPGDFLEWSIDNVTWTPFINGGVVTGLPAGPAPSFNLDVSIRKNSSDLCNAKAIINLQSTNPAITATFNVTPATCNGSDGAVTVTAAGGGGGPYEFSIDNGNTFQTSNNFTNLSGGSYAMIVRDASGCTQSFTVNITFPGFINHTIVTTDAACTVNGSISVAISDAGQFKVALSQDQFNEPDDADYQNYTGSSVTFADLPRGEYFVYIKSTGATCPTRTAPINILGVFSLAFEVEAQCDDEKRSIRLTNMQYDKNSGVPYTIHVYNKNNNLEMAGFPLTVSSSDPQYQLGSYFLSYSTYTFLQSPDEYIIQIEQLQTSVFCNKISDPVEYVVPFPIQLRGIETTMSPSDIDIGSIKIEITSGTGTPDYNTSIKLDSASAQTQFYEDAHATVPVDVDGRFIDLYENVPAGRYEVIVADKDGCSLETVARVILDTRVIIPNVFTPNDDDVNDTFYIRNLPESGNQLLITNRWGAEVFASKDYNRANFWSGEGVVDGLYFYRLQVDGGEVFTGWVEIMRGAKP